MAGGGTALSGVWRQGLRSAMPVLKTACEWLCVEYVYAECVGVCMVTGGLKLLLSYWKRDKQGECHSVLCQRQRHPTSPGCDFFCCCCCCFLKLIPLNDGIILNDGNQARLEKRGNIISYSVQRHRVIHHSMHSTLIDCMQRQVFPYAKSVDKEGTRPARSSRQLRPNGRCARHGRTLTLSKPPRQPQQNACPHSVTATAPPLPSPVPRGSRHSVHCRSGRSRASALRYVTGLSDMGNDGMPPFARLGGVMSGT